jgi:predicted RNA-binding Zn ribbon-like protein
MVTSSDRFQLDRAPGGLALVQDLINTSLAEVGPRAFADQLETADSAQHWLDEALRQWRRATGQDVAAVRLGASDAVTLRLFREELRSRLGARGQRPETSPFPTAIALRWTRGRVPDYEPRGDGWKAVAAIIEIEALLASRDRSWERLKTCANASCGLAFYDRSPNVGRRWHDTKTCGNVANLRASRSRRSGSGI